jgi:hypothetical protein
LTEGRSRLATLPAWVAVAVPIVISVISLVVSIIGLFISTQLPQAHLELPAAVRAAQGEQAGFGTGISTLYVQPSFVSTNSNPRAEVIEGLKLVVKPKQGEPVEFTWSTQGEWGSPDPTAQTQQYGESSYAQFYKVTSDPTPLVVNPGAAVAPVLHFSAPADFQFKEGSYDLILTANRAIVSDPLEDKMTITFTQDHIEYFKSTKGASWQVLWDVRAYDEQLRSIERLQSRP